MHRVSLLLALLLPCAACASPPLSVRADLYPHVLSIDTDGRSNELVLKGETRVRDDLEEHVQAIAAGLVASGQKHVVLVIHGGLVSRKRALREAKRQFDAMGRETDFYPIFVNWETGMRASYRDHLLRVRGGLRSRWAPLTAPLYFIADLGRALARLPITLLAQSLQNVADYGHRPPSVPPNGWKRSMWIDRRDERRSGWETAKVHALGVVPGAARIVTTPLLDGIGRSAFLNMRRRARVLFLLDEAFDEPERTEEGALSLLMEELRRVYYESYEETSERYDAREAELFAQVEQARSAWLADDVEGADALVRNVRATRDELIVGDEAAHQDASRQAERVKASDSDCR